MSGAIPPGSQDVAKASDRLTFVYLERCIVHRDSNALTATDDRGTVHIPMAMIGALLLGPGTRITHAAMSVIGAAGASVIWVGEGSVRCYAAGRPLARSTRLLEAQARAFSSQKARLRIAREMYEMRFPDEDVSHLTMQQLRGREGARVRKIYAAESQRTSVDWVRRDYKAGDIADSDPVNQALSSANSCLYGVIAAVIHSLGMAPGLGFVHVGHDLSFVYDVADLFKAETTIPAAFDVVASGSVDPVNDVRRLLRDRLMAEGVMERAVKILRDLFLDGATAKEEPLIMYDEALSIWSGRSDNRLSSGQNYG
ncbi:type I-E CRISPR-associated endonuclease Cas1e [Flaviflexus equikiangi]|uniref:type I-E CRISPR-associated endonuclease Cas1e n=1 Tax=Flaviflexus equikiangi TaxID=2758573 RepID=UPI0015F6F0E4|nr:type I-E CRISPR-associated endonuclease Cas1e [Flaviflexus equikiangi]